MALIAAVAAKNASRCQKQTSRRRSRMSLYDALSQAQVSSGATSPLTHRGANVVRSISGGTLSWQNGARLEQQRNVRKDSTGEDTRSPTQYHREGEHDQALGNAGKDGAEEQILQPDNEWIVKKINPVGIL